MNIFTNPDENRLRAGWRISTQLFLMFLIGFGLIWVVSRFYPVSGRVLPTIAIAIGAVVSVWLAARGMDRRAVTDYGLESTPRMYQECMLGFFGAGFVMGLIFLVEFAAGWINITGFGWQHTNSTPYLLLFAGYLGWMIIVGIYEELVFRGYQIVNMAEGFNLPGTTKRQAALGSVVLSSLIFGILHATNPSAGLISTINVTLAGGMLALPFIISGRLSLSIGLHIGWNFFQGGVFGFPVSGMPARTSLLQIRQSGPELVTGGSFGPEAGLLGIAGFLLIAALLVIYFRIINQPIAVHEKFGTYTPSTRHYPV